MAKASLQELLLDYEDYLRVRGKERWTRDGEKYRRTLDVADQHLDSAFYRQAVKERGDTAVANIAIVLIHLTDKLLHELIRQIENDFIKNGGIKELMTRTRIEYRKNIKKNGN